MKIIRRTFSVEEHRQVAAHFYAINDHIHSILDLLSGRVYVKWLDVLLGPRSKIGKVRSALDDDFIDEYGLPSPYYGADGADEPREHPPSGPVGSE